MNKINMLLAFTLIFGGAGSAIAEEEAADSAKSDCFFVRTIGSWAYIDKRHVYIKGTSKDQFLLTLYSSCNGLRSATAVALSNSRGTMCPNDYGKLTFRDAGGKRSCRISNVERVENKSAAKEKAA